MEKRRARRRRESPRPRKHATAPVPDGRTRSPEGSRLSSPERLPSDFHPGARCRRGDIRLGLWFKGVGVLDTGRALFVCGALLRSCRLHRGDLLPDRRRLLLFFLFTSNQGHHHRTRQERPSEPFYKFYLHKNTYGSRRRFAFDKSFFIGFPAISSRKNGESG